jgi:hypothetical protein
MRYLVILALTLGMSANAIAQEQSGSESIVTSSVPLSQFQPGLPKTNTSRNRLTPEQAQALLQQRQEAAGVPAAQQVVNRSAPVMQQQISDDIYGRLNQDDGRGDAYDDAGGAMLSTMQDKYKPVVDLKLIPGANEIWPIGKGLLNRIETNFENAEGVSSDPDATIQGKGRFLYVMVNGDAPLNLYVQEKEVPESAVNLTLWPLPVTPVLFQLEVQMDNELKAKIQERQKALKQEQMETEALLTADIRSSNEYIERNMMLLTATAKTDVPPGFSVTELIPEDEMYPCESLGLKTSISHRTAQQVLSTGNIINVVAIKNKGNQAAEFREEYCMTRNGALDKSIIAVGIYPKAILMPGESAEVYILKDRLHAAKQGRKAIRSRVSY